MNWRSLGHVYKCDDYGQTPTPLVLQDRVRVFVAARDSEGKSYTRFVDLDLDDPTQIIEVSGPVLGRGKPGCFDQDGAMPSYAEIEGHSVTLYYSGWTAPAGVTPYHNATGCARSENFGLTFERRTDGPVMDRTEREPYLRVTPCHYKGSTWWVSGLRWERIGDRWEPIYVIRGGDGFRMGGEIAIPQKHEQECFSRPWVFRRTGDAYKMIYSYRSAIDYRDGQNSYRLGMAESKDLYEWVRCDDEINLPRTPGFDDTMQCYASTFDVKGKTYMVYNGNSFGKFGFALAVLE